MIEKLGLIESGVCLMLPDKHEVMYKINQLIDASNRQDEAIRHLAFSMREEDRIYTEITDILEGRE
jgi:hypothetical protein